MVLQKVRILGFAEGLEVALFPAILLPSNGASAVTSEVGAGSRTIIIITVIIIILTILSRRGKTA